MNSTVTAGPPVRSRLALIVAGVFALFGSFLVTAPAQAGYYDSSYPCSYRCGYPAYRYYQPYRPVYRHRCSSCGPRLIYERRFIERQYVERRYGYGGGYRRHYGYSPYGYRRNYGYSPYGGYRSSSRPYGYGYGGVGRRWSLPYAEGYQRSGYSGYDDQPRPPAPISNEGDYY